MSGATCAIFMMTFAFPRQIPTRAVQQSPNSARIKTSFDEVADYVNQKKALRLSES